MKCIRNIVYGLLEIIDGMILILTFGLHHKLNDPTNNVHDEDGIWILNPDDFDSECDDDNDIGDFDDMI